MGHSGSFSPMSSLLQGGGPSGQEGWAPGPHVWGGGLGTAQYPCCSVSIGVRTASAHAYASRTAFTPKMSPSCRIL